MNEFSIENIFILSISKYENFSILSALSKKLGRVQFLAQNSLLDTSEKFDSGFLIKIKYKTQGNFFKILDYKLFFSFDISTIECERLFAIQSLASLIEKFIKNIDDINLMIPYIPKIISIFYEKNWLDIYLFIEFKILNFCFDCKRKTNINNLIQLKDNLLYNEVYCNNINNRIEIFNFCLQKLENLWYNFDNTIILPKERTIFKKLLINL